MDELSETFPGLLPPRVMIGELSADAGQTEMARATSHQVVIMPSKFVSDKERQLLAHAIRAPQTREPHE